MCGIVGFTGTQQAAPILLSGLSKLEYRGYDSAGIAVRDGERLAQVVKAKGRLGNLIEKTDEGKALIGTCGIGHTRWATHGEPSQINAHPHVSGNCTRSGSGEVESEVVGVHNGIIENYQELKDNPKYQEWIDSMATLAFPGGESPQQFKDRCIAGFDKMVDTCIRRHYRNVAMVVHGGTIMSILEQYGVPQKSYYDWRVENGCGYHLYLSEQNWKMGRREAVVESEIRR